MAIRRRVRGHKRREPGVAEFSENIMLEWRVFGCGSPSSTRSTQTSYEIADNGQRIQIDLGHGAIYQHCRLEKAIEPAVDSISNLLLTHCHPDHCVDLTRLYVAWMYTPGFKPQNKVKLYGTEPTMDAIKRMMDNMRLEEGYEKAYDPHIIKIGEPFQLYGFTIQAKPAIHIEGACGYGFDTPSGKRVAYTGDTGFHEALFKIWKNLHLLVIETSFSELETPYHLTLNQTAIVAGKTNPGALLLVHFYPDMERLPEEEIKTRIAKYYDGPVFIAKDGLALQWNDSSQAWRGESMF